MEEISDKFRVKITKDWLMSCKLSAVRSIGIKKKFKGIYAYHPFINNALPMHPNLSFINPSFVSRPCSIPFFLLLEQAGCSGRATLRLVIEGGKKCTKREKT